MKCRVRYSTFSALQLAFFCSSPSFTTQLQSSRLVPPRGRIVKTVGTTSATWLGSARLGPRLRLHAGAFVSLGLRGQAAGAADSSCLRRRVAVMQIWWPAVARTGFERLLFFAFRLARFIFAGRRHALARSRIAPEVADEASVNEPPRDRPLHSARVLSIATSSRQFRLRSRRVFRTYERRCTVLFESSQTKSQSILENALD